MADVEDQVRDCLRRHATEAQPDVALVANARARSDQLARRSRIGSVLAIVPIVAGVAVASVAVAGGGSPANRGQAIGVVTSSATPSQPSKVHSPTNCPRGTLPNLQRLSQARSIAVRPIGEPMYIRRYVHARPNQDVASLTPTPHVLVDGARLPKGSIAVEIVTRHHLHYWQLLMARPVYWHRVGGHWVVYNAAWKGCAAPRRN